MLRHHLVRLAFGGQCAVQTKTASPQTIGLACPCPFNAAFQTTFLFSGPPHVSGRSASCVYPSPVGPRKPGQFSALADVKSEKSSIAAIAWFRIMPR